MYTVIFPTNGIILFALVFVAVILIAAFLIARRLGLKQVIAAVLLAAAVIFRVVEGLGDSVGFPPTLQYIGRYNFIPFAKLFFVPGEGHWSSIENHLYYLTPILTDLAAALLLGILWGLLAPIIFKATTAKKYIKITLLILLPVQLLVNLSHLFYMSYSEHFDMGSYVVMALSSFPCPLQVSAIPLLNVLYCFWCILPSLH